MNANQQQSDGATRVAYILGVPLAENVVRQWPQMGEIVRTSWLIAEVEGESACTGISLVADDWVGVFIVGTVPAYRRRGLGAALTAKLVTDAVARNGVRQALLQSSAMGKRVYESLGFATVETWTRWTTSA